MNHIESIEKSLKENLPYQEIARKIYLTYPTSALIGREEHQYEIVNEVSQFFRIPINHVQVCGSSKTGMSFHKRTVFTPKKSDLDIAIIDNGLFLQYTEKVFTLTKGFNDRTKFRTDTFEKYINYLSRGIFRPDLMPTCLERVQWFEFFNNLSVRHSSYFKSINAGVYQTQLYFEYKQINNIREYKNSKPI